MMTSKELAKFDGPDDETVGDQELFWRRIYPGWIVVDQIVNSRLSSQAYEETRKPEPSPCSLDSRDRELYRTGPERSDIRSGLDQSSDY